MNELDVRLADYEQRFIRLEEYQNTMLKWIDQQKQAIVSLSDQVAQLTAGKKPEAAAPKTPGAAYARNQTTYAAYLEVQKGVLLGKADKVIAKELGIPYTTVRKYKTWTEDDIIKAKAKESEDAVRAARAKEVVPPAMLPEVLTVATQVPALEPAMQPFTMDHHVGIGSIPVEPELDESEQPFVAVEPEALVEVRRPRPILPAPTPMDGLPAAPRLIGHTVNYATSPPTFVAVYEGQAYNAQTFIPYKG